MEKKKVNTLHITKLLTHLKNNPHLFQEKDLNFIVGLTSTEIANAKKVIFGNTLATRFKQDVILSDAGLQFIKKNPLNHWSTEEYPNRPEINLEYLKLEKHPPTLTKAIRQLAVYLLEGGCLKPYSMEENIYREIFSEKSSCNKLCTEVKDFISQNTKINLGDFYQKFMSAPYGLTKSLTFILLLNALIETKDELAIYELSEFQLNLDTNMYFRMFYAPQRFEFQKTVVSDLSVLNKISKILLRKQSSNVLNITKGLILSIKSLDGYTMKTSDLSSESLRLRNAVIHAKDPICLFFRDIPNIYGCKNLEECNDTFVNQFEHCIKEMQNNYSNLILELKNFLLDAFQTGSRKNISQRFKVIEEYLNDKNLKILSKNIREENASDDLWIERIATFINGAKVPKDWTDIDVADFKVRLKGYSDKFLLLEATAGQSEVKLDKAMQQALTQLLNLEKSKQIAVIRKVINE